MYNIFLLHPKLPIVINSQNSAQMVAEITQKGLSTKSGHGFSWWMVKKRQTK